MHLHAYYQCNYFKKLIFPYAKIEIFHKLAIYIFACTIHSFGIRHMVDIDTLYSHW